MIAELSRGRVATLYVTALSAMAVALSAADLFAPRLVYNASASVPVGWYAVGDAADLEPGDIVVAHPPVSAEAMLVDRGYLGAGVPLLKHVAAAAGTEVCRLGDTVSIDGTPVGTARDADARGRALPRWSGCRTLGPSEIFLFNPDAPGSFDGRYFGPTRTRDIIGKARPLWTW